MLEILPNVDVLGRRTGCNYDYLDCVFSPLYRIVDACPLPAFKRDALSKHASLGPSQVSCHIRRLAYHCLRRPHHAFYAAHPDIASKNGTAPGTDHLFFCCFSLQQFTPARTCVNFICSARDRRYRRWLDGSRLRTHPTQIYVVVDCVFNQKASIRVFEDLVDADLGWRL